MYLVLKAVRTKKKNYKKTKITKTYMTDVALWFPFLRLDTNITAKLGYHKKSDKQTHFHLLSPLTDLSTYWSNYC